MGHSNKSKLKLVDKTCFVSDDATIAKQSNMLNNCKLEDIANSRRDGEVVRASASQSVDLGFIPLVESY